MAAALYARLPNNIIGTNMFFVTFAERIEIYDTETFYP
jgi:hypothetical protein